MHVIKIVFFSISSFSLSGKSKFSIYNRDYNRLRNYLCDFFSRLVEGNWNFRFEDWPEFDWEAGIFARNCWRFQDIGAIGWKSLVIWMEPYEIDVPDEKKNNMSTLVIEKTVNKGSFSFNFCNFISIPTEILLSFENPP